MDRTIPTTERRARTLRRALIPTVILVGIGIGAWQLLGFVRPSLERARLRTDFVHVGSIESTIGAVGTVVPRDEQIIVSPIDSRVTRIRQRVGATVATGDTLLVLDDAPLRADLDAIDDRIALQRNAMAKARLELQNTITDLRTQRGIKELALESAVLEIHRNRALRAKGLVTIDVLHKSETDSARTSMEIEQLSQRETHEEKSLAIDVERLELEIDILEGERDEARARLLRASAPAARDGIVTWVVAREGTAVQRGSELARVADLSAFAVEARVAGSHAELVREGQIAHVRSGEVRLDARITRVEPTIDQGTFVVELALEDPGDPSLRHNAQVDVEIVTAERPRTLIVRRGTFVRHDGRQHVFVVRDDRAVRTPITLGVANSENTEIVEGLEAGDEIVLTDMTRHARNREVLLK